jgi:hypothetical protein
LEFARRKTRLQNFRLVRRVLRQADQGAESKSPVFVEQFIQMAPGAKTVDTGGEFPLEVGWAESGQDGVSCAGETLASDDSDEFATSVHTRVTKGKLSGLHLAVWAKDEGPEADLRDEEATTTAKSGMIS